MSNRRILLAGASMEFLLRIKDKLQQMGYESVTIVNSYIGAMEFIIRSKPDILITDLALSGSKSGLDLALWVNQKHPLPLIFISEQYLPEYTPELLKVAPSAYFVHPISPINLSNSIELALDGIHHNPISMDEVRAFSPSLSKMMFIKEGNSFVRINHECVQYIESHENYVKIFLQGRLPLTVRSTMKEILDLLPEGHFVRISRRHIVGVEYIDKITQGVVYVQGNELSIGKTFRDQLYTSLGIRESGVSL